MHVLYLTIILDSALCSKLAADGVIIWVLCPRSFVEVLCMDMRALR
jgi:hypothetical protein